MDLDALSHLLIVLAACDWVFTALIFIAARQMQEAALTERATTSVILSVIGSIAALLGAGRLGYLSLPTGASVILLSVALVLVSVPQFIWVIGLALGRFK